MIRKFVLIAGHEPDGNMVGYHIVDLIFDRALLMLYSWTGKSAPTTPKLSFRVFDQIVDVFHEIIWRCDQQFTKQMTKLFFRDKILKFSKRRHFGQKQNLTPRNPVRETEQNNIPDERNEQQQELANLESFVVKEEPLDGENYGIN